MADQSLLVRFSGMYRTLVLLYQFCIDKKRTYGLHFLLMKLFLNPRGCFNTISSVVFRARNERSQLPIIPEPKNLFKKLIIFTGVPLGDVGGGQRSAQLARCATLAGVDVVYVFLYQSYDFNKQCYFTPESTVQGVKEIHIDALQLEDLHCDSTVVALFELPHARLVPFLRVLNSCAVTTIYELIDDWDSSLGAEWFSNRVHQQFLQESKRVVATADFLFEKIKGLGREDVELLPNAANELIFNKYMSYSRPKEYKYSKKIGLYVGSLYGEWFSWDYVIGAAWQNPEIDFFIIGNYNDIKELPTNVKLLGQRSITEVPPYIAHATFTFIPFLPSNIIDATSPIKVFEYLFMGKPVVSTRIRDIVAYPGVSIADSVDEFAQLCRNVSHQSKEARSCNDSFISHNSWFSRLDKLIGQVPVGQEISLVVLCYNNKDIIDRLIRSVQWHCSEVLKDFIIVDNQSTDGSYEYIKQRYPEITLLRNEVNGCSSGRNLGVRKARGEYIAFLDSDQWLTSRLGFIKAVHLLKNNRLIGAVGWAAGWFADPTLRSLGSHNVDGLSDLGINTQHVALGYRDDLHYLGTGGFFMRKSDFSVIGGFDEYYDPTCFEDTDLSFKIKAFGKQVVYSRLPGIMHEPHQTTQANSNNELYQCIFKRNELYFKRKWLSDLKSLMHS